MTTYRDNGFVAAAFRNFHLADFQPFLLKIQINLYRFFVNFLLIAQNVFPTEKALNYKSQRL